MINLLTRKLELFGSLPREDKQLLDDVIQRSKPIASHEDIIREGDVPKDVHLILEGFACRYKVLATGDRQILAYLVPGDFCDLNVFILNAMDHNIGSLSACRVVDIPRERILELLQRPQIARALMWCTLVDEATLREWLVNIGQRDAERRIAHLFCEVHLRLKSVGLADGGEFALPITQIEIGDTMGISAVHVNRSLQSLRAKGLIALRKKRLVIKDVDQLRQMSGFNPNYLHLQGGKQDKITYFRP